MTEEVKTEKAEKKTKIVAKPAPLQTAVIAPEAAPNPMGTLVQQLQQMPQLLQRFIAVQEQNSKDLAEIKTILKFISPQR